MLFALSSEPFDNLKLPSVPLPLRISMEVDQESGTEHALREQRVQHDNIGVEAERRQPCAPSKRLHCRIDLSSLSNGVRGNPRTGRL
jgi:hypothetical protein